MTPSEKKNQSTETDWELTELVDKDIETILWLYFICSEVEGRICKVKTWKILKDQAELLEMKTCLK